MPEIIDDIAEINLANVAATICAELRSENKSGAALLHHAMNAGDALNLAQANLHKTNLPWKQWVRENCFINWRTARVFASSSQTTARRLKRSTKGRRLLQHPRGAAEDHEEQHQAF